MDALHNSGMRMPNIKKMMIHNDFGKYTEKMHNDTLTADKPYLLDEEVQDAP